MGKQQCWSMRGCKGGQWERGASLDVGRYVKARLGTTGGGLGGGETGRARCNASGQASAGKSQECQCRVGGWGCGAGGERSVWY